MVIKLEKIILYPILILMFFGFAFYFVQAETIDPADLKAFDPPQSSQPQTPSNDQQPVIWLPIDNSRLLNPDTNPDPSTRIPLPTVNTETGKGGEQGRTKVESGGKSGSTKEESGGKQTPGKPIIIPIPNPLGKTQTLAQLVKRVAGWLAWIGGSILTLMIIIGAFQIMTGAGNPELLSKGKQTIVWAVIGYAILLLSTGIINVVEDILGSK